MKGRFPWIKTGPFLEILRPCSSQWQRVAQLARVPTWTSSDCWNLASEVFHGLWVNHRLLSHFQPQTAQVPRKEQRFGYLSLKCYPWALEFQYKCWLRPFSPTCHFSVWPQMPESWHCWADKHWCLSYSSLRGFKSSSRGHPNYPGWDAVTRWCGEHFGSCVEISTRPSMTDLDLFPSSATWLCRGRTAGPLPSSSPTWLVDGAWH